MTTEEKFKQVFGMPFNNIGNTTSQFGYECQKAWLNAKYITESDGTYISKEEAIAMIPKVIGGKNDFADAIRDSVEAVIDACESIKQDSYYKDLAQSYEETINKLIKAVADQGNALDRVKSEVNAIQIPSDATNGDVIKIIFPFCKTRSENTPTSFMEFTLDGVVGYSIEKSWWNAPYKTESEVEDADSN